MSSRFGSALNIPTHSHRVHFGRRLLTMGLLARRERARLRARRRRAQAEARRAGTTPATDGRAPRRSEGAPVRISAATRTFEPPAQRDLHAGYHAVRDGRPLDATSPPRGRLVVVRAAYAPPPRPPRASPSTSPIDDLGAKDAPARPASDPTTPPRRRQGRPPAVAPPPPATSYAGDMDELLLALTSNGVKKPEAVRRIRDAQLAPGDDLATALAKVFRTP